MSRVKEQLDQLGALVLDAAEQASADTTSQRTLLHALGALKTAVATNVVDPALKKDVAATNLLRCLLMSIQAYHGKVTGADAIVQVFCDILGLAFDVSATNDCLEVLLSKTAPLYAKLTIVRAMAPLDYALVAGAGALLPELLSLTTKHARHADLYVRHTLFAALAAMLRQFGFHAVPFHSEVVRLVAKAATDKCPEVRVVAGEILFVLVDATDLNDPSGAALDALFHVLVKAVDDEAPEVRRVMSVAMGKLLSLYVLRGDRHVPDAGSVVVPATPLPGADGGDADDHRFKSLNFRLATVLTRRPKSPAGLSSVPLALHFIKETFLAPGAPVGAAFGAAAIVAANLCDFLPDDFSPETSFTALLDALLGWLDGPPLTAATEYVRARNALGYALRRIAHTLQERSQPAWVRALLSHLALPAWSHHQRLVLLVELSHAVHALGEAAVVFFADAASGLAPWLAHEKHSVRLEAAVATAALAIAVPYRRRPLLESLLDALDRALAATAASADTPGLYAVHGASTAVAHVLRALKLADAGVARTLYERVLATAERMVATQFQSQAADAVWLTCTRAGWDLVGAVVAVDAAFTRTVTGRLVALWLQAGVPQARDPAQELLRMEGAVVALYCFWAGKPVGDGLATLSAQLLHATLEAAVAFGSPAKQRAKVAKHRVVAWTLKTFACLPPQTYADSWMRLLDLVAEFTTAQPLTSLARASLVPPATTYLSAPSHVLEVLSPVRMVAGDAPDPMLPRGLNLLLALLQPDTALSDVEMETAYLDNFLAQLHGATGSAFTYVRMVDTCVALFPAVFLAAPDELQLRVLQHFAGVLGDHKLDCVANVCALLLATVREAQLQAREMVVFAGAPWLAAVQAMLVEMLAAPAANVRRGAAEALGLAGALAGDSALPGLVHDLETKLLAEMPDNQSVALAGTALALAHLKRSCGSRCAVDAALLFRATLDHVFSMAQPVRSWCLHAWNLLLECVNTSGDYEEQYVAPSLALIDAHLLAGTRFTPPACAFKKTVVLRRTASVGTALGQIVNSIVSALGPELLQAPARLEALYGVWDLLRLPADPRVELEYWRFVEQLVLFAPTYFRATDLVRLQALLLDKTTPPACRSVLLLIVRILVEREPGLIATYGLHVGLFQALEVHERAVDWTAMPPWRGLLVPLARPPASAVAELQGCVNALLLTDIGRLALDNGGKAVEWLLLGRGIAVGGFTALAESPRGKDANVAMDLWRRTSHRVATLLNPLPAMRRRVREFAVQCVLAVLEIVAASKVAATHFDVAAARAALGGDDANFVALYVDELVTLGCQMSAVSMDGFELQQVQSVGMRLLNAVLERFGGCIDPDEPGALLLGQYQAQLSATVRRAFPKTEPAHEPLVVQGYYLLAHVLGSGIVQDKVAVGRLAKLAAIDDVTFPLAGTDADRFAFALAALSSLARLHTAVPAAPLDVAALMPAWVAAVRDFCALSLPLGPADFAGAYFASATPVEPLRTVALAHIAPVLAAVGAAGDHATLVLTATLLHMAQTSKHAEAALPLLRSLPALCTPAFWASLSRESYENILQTLVLFCSSSLPAVQTEALRGLQLLLTKDGAAFVTRTLRTDSDSVGNAALQHTLAVAATYVLRHACSTKEYPRAVVVEALRTAIGGTVLLAPTPTFGAGFVLVATDVLARFLHEPWFPAVGGPYIESTVRCAVAGDTAPPLPAALQTLLGALQALLLDAAVTGDALRFVVAAAKAVLTHAGALVATDAFHAAVAPAIAARLATDASSDTLAAAHELSDVAPVPYLRLVGPAVVALLSHPIDADRLDAVDGVLSVACSKMPVPFVDALLQLILPLLVPLYNSLPSSVGRMLVMYATAYATSFKAAVAGLSPATKASLEGILRSALSRPAPVAAPTPMNLDLSRYA
ncbi:hypothetical protein ACHHYP_10479 [Achlya hypogyna]|uniref:Uncharacterized protein n=1 Tax=Achlya hypogyna TaxID=1202772 RepID=A0A1V9YLA7_ACHHY|nr:hypothetical protein ACHHYP_10479 [Achlya hypogyna]